MIDWMRKWSRWLVLGVGAILAGIGAVLTRSRLDELDSEDGPDVDEIHVRVRKENHEILHEIADTADDDVRSDKLTQWLESGVKKD